MASSEICNSQSSALTTRHALNTCSTHSHCPTPTENQTSKGQRTPHKETSQEPLDVYISKTNPGGNMRTYLGTTFLPHPALPPPRQFPRQPPPPYPLESLPAPRSPVGSWTTPHPAGGVLSLLTFSTSCLGCGGSMHVRSLSNRSMMAEVPMCFIIRSTKSRFFFKKSTI